MKYLSEVWVNIIGSIGATALIGGISQFFSDLDILHYLLLALLLFFATLAFKNYCVEKGDHAVGISSVKNSKKRTLSYLEKANMKIDFWGLSGHSTIKSTEFESLIHRLSERNGEIRILLLEPDCEASKQRAKDEGESHESHRSEILASLSRLRRLKLQFNANIQVREYSHYPIW